MKKKVLVTGVNGQDGSYLSELLLIKNHVVIGMVRRSSQNTLRNIEHLLNNEDFNLEYGDVSDIASLIRILSKWKPDMIFNLAAQSYVACSFETPAYTAEVDAIGAINVLEAAKYTVPTSKIYQASTSEIFGNTIKKDKPLTERSSKVPVSPYGVSKLFAFRMAQLYRRMYGMFICNGILFNHESERRGEEFVTRKITKYIAKRILASINGEKIKPLQLGNIVGRRDWGYAPEYVNAMYSMMTKEIPDDYVIATGEDHSVLEFIQECFDILEIDVEVQCKNLTTSFDETSMHVEGEIATINIVKNDNKHNFGLSTALIYAFQVGSVFANCYTNENLRPVDINKLVGNFNKANQLLNWNPSTSFRKLCEKMLYNDILMETGLSPEKI